MKIWEFLEANGDKVWTQRTLATDSKSHVVDVFDPTAQCFCSLGLLYKFYGSACIEQEYQFAEVLKISPLAISVWNDNVNRTFQDVLEAFKKADL